MSKCEHGLTTKECYVCMSPKYGEKKNNMSIEAMKQWLEALATEEYRLRQTGQSQVYSGIWFVITSLRQAIEQAEKQEPVAECVDDGEGGMYYKTLAPNAPIGLLYTTPQPQKFVCSTGLCHYKPQREWVGLTTDERVELMQKVPHLTIGGLLAVEAKLKERNHVN